jgi:hypothetical protein
MYGPGNADVRKMACLLARKRRTISADVRSPLVMTKHFALWVTTAPISALRCLMRLSFIKIGQSRDAASAIHSVSATSSSLGMP